MQRNHGKQQAVFHPDEGVVIPPGVGIVDDEPEPGKKGIDHLQRQSRDSRSR